MERQSFKSGALQKIGDEQTMKFNLKNRPQVYGGIFNEDSYSTKEVTDWFVGFEKEIRRELEQSDLYVVEANAIKLRTERERKIARLFLEKGIVASAKEVLGDSD